MWDQLIDDALDGCVKGGLGWAWRKIGPPSELIYASDSKDLTQSSGDLASVGKTLSDAATKNALPGQQTIAIGVWRIFDDPK